MKTHFISVIIPTRTINDYIIKENLPAFTIQTYTNFEVIVLPNEADSFDSALMKHYPWLRIIPTIKATRPAEKRDIGAKHAKGNVVAFIDDDGYPSQNWLERAVETFNEKQYDNIAAVCGPGVLPPHAEYWERVFDAVLKTWIGSGGYSYRFNPEHRRLVDDFPSMNFIVKKEIFHKIGGFNSDYWPGEDSKLCEDIVYKEKGVIVYNPDVLVYHHRRNSIQAYLKQHGNYGFHRGAFFAHGDKNSRRLGYLIPSMFVIYVILLTSIFTVIPTHIGETGTVMLIPGEMYILFVLYLFFKSLFAQKSLPIALGSAIVLFLTHVWYGILFIKGFFAGLTKKKDIY